MKRRAGSTAIIFTLIGVGVLVWVGLATREPTYQGKTLPQWAVQFHTNRWPLDKKAEAAIKHFGTNGIPILLETMSRQEKPYRIWLGNHVPKTWLTWLKISSGQVYKNEIDSGRSAAASSFKALGEDARPAVPGLIALLQHKDQRVRYLAVFALRTLGPLAKPALPDLIDCLKDPEFTIRDDAVMSMGTIRAEPERVVPIIMEFIEKNRSDGILCRDAMGALGNFEADAKQAVPVIQTFLNDQDANTRMAATNALMRIDPGSLPEATPAAPSK
jgi:HEAT repeat protein